MKKNYQMPVVNVTVLSCDAITTSAVAPTHKTAPGLGDIVEY